MSDGPRSRMTLVFKYDVGEYSGEATQYVAEYDVSLVASVRGLSSTERVAEELVKQLNEGLIGALKVTNDTMRVHIAEKERARLEQL